MIYDIVALNEKLVSELKEIAKELNIPKYDKLLRQDLIYKILDHQAINPSPEILEKEKKEQKKEFRQRKKIIKPMTDQTIAATSNSTSRNPKAILEKFDQCPFLSYVTSLDLKMNHLIEYKNKNLKILTCQLYFDS